MWCRRAVTTSACGILPLPLNYSKPLHWEKAKAKKGKNNLRNRGLLKDIKHRSKPEIRFCLRAKI